VSRIEGRSKFLPLSTILVDEHAYSKGYSKDNSKQCGGRIGCEYNGKCVKFKLKQFYGWVYGIIMASLPPGRDRKQQKQKLKPTKTLDCRLSATDSTEKWMVLGSCSPFLFPVLFNFILCLLFLGITKFLLYSFSLLFLLLLWYIISTYCQMRMCAAVCVCGLFIDLWLVYSSIITLLLAASCAIHLLLSLPLSFSLFCSALSLFLLLSLPLFLHDVANCRAHKT